MSSIQERLQLKRVPLDTWNIREQLCLASAVMRSGDQNWMSVSRALKTIGDPNRPADWYSQKSCAAQYGVLLENVETPKRKKRASEGAVETPQESILKKLTQERMTEIQNTLAELNQQYSVVKNEVAELRDPQTSEDRIKEIWAGIEASKRLREKEQAKRAAWLKEREERRLRAEKSWRPSPPISTSPLITSNPVVQQSQPSSPLLSSLLKSSPVVTTPQHIPHPANVVETISPSAGAPTLSMLLDKRPSTHDNEHAAIEHIKSEIVQLERQLKVAASNSPPPQVTMPSAVTIPTHPSTVPHAVDKIDLDDIEIKAEDVYAFSDIDLEIPPVSSIHKPIREEPKIVVPIEEDSKKEEDVDVDTIPADEPAAPPVVIPTTVPETVEIPPPPPPAPVVEVVKPDELEVCVTDEDDSFSILPQESESKSAEPNTVEEDIQQCVAKVDDAYMMNDTPGLPHVEEETQVISETESATQGASQEQNVQVEEKIVEQDNSEPSNTETEPQPQTETEPQTETTEAITTETTSTSEVSNETVSEVKAEENIMETEEPMIVENPKECEKPIEEINPVVEEVEESFVAVVEEVTKQEPIDEEKPIEEIKEESKKEAESIPPLVSEDSSKHEDTHTETDDDVPMELIREEEKDGKKKRDYSRKRKYDSRACSGSESAPDSPASSEADRQHKMWKKAVMVVHNRLCAHKCASLFLRPITNDQAPNYDKIVKKPMDLSSIKKNIDAGIIRTTSEFRRCVLLMLSNALFYNSVTHDVHRMTKEMHKEADAQLGMLVQAQAHAELPLAPRTHTHKRRSHTHTPKRPRIE